MSNTKGHIRILQSKIQRVHPNFIRINKRLFPGKTMPEITEIIAKKQEREFFGMSKLDVFVKNQGESLFGKKKTKM